MNRPLILLLARSAAMGFGLAGVFALPIEVASAQSQHRISIPAGTLDAALRSLARQTGISVGGTIQGLRQIRTPTIEGEMSAEAALRLLLRGTGFTFRRSGNRTYRIERRLLPQRSAPPPSPSAQQTPPPAPARPIIVTASKRELYFSDYAGGATVIELDDALPGIQLSSLEGLLSSLPITASTNLGSGRNKLFIRGIADSSFNGPTQSTVGLYYGDLRLIYSAPNPDLRLYDIDRVELLEGPQGTLYGAGALGGVIRLSPSRAALGEWEGAAWASGTVTEGGEPGYDLAGMVNVPVGDRIAARVLGYSGRLGGYVDDLQRGLGDINRTEIEGWRATIRVEIAEGWTIDLDGVQQMLDTLDGQYVDADIGGLNRRSAIAQPFDSDISGAGITITGAINGLSLISATGVFRSDLDTIFDASALSDTDEILGFEEERRIDLVSHETRIASGREASFSWVIGGSLVRNIDRRFQFLGDPDDPDPRAETRNETTEIAVFGEGTLPLTPRLSATAGTRIVYSESFSEALLADGSEIDPQASSTRVLPTAGLSWRPNDDAMVYGRYQRGYRASGLSIDGVDTMTPTVSRFEPDSLQTIELGTHVTVSQPMSVELSVIGFFTNWDGIQADLIGDQGFSLTRNIGSARVYGITASASVQPVEQLRISGAFFANQTHFDAATDLDAGEEERLPNVAEFGARASVELTIPISDAWRFEAVTALDYTGESFLGVDPTLEFAQGGYFEVDATIALRSDDWTLSIEGSNLSNVRGNSFAFGNPFAVRDAQQTTPVRPREIRFSSTVQF
ncbi:TonB-dependent receptor [Parasphingopyxis algicola]|uniref:TonB-dependent receptor domain-containing protein n=1 Tax=Parasphingopyxis algicola TaxID=2026624 RepID=UPI0015A2678E|nr:TonB-dependent receptor [Parasphingopyxis algicola]QLC24410.1 TonB-dependent receptor [Parasphingopyxis algicola]